MDNWDRWLEYTSGLGSPQRFVEWAGLFVPGAALERRVWCPPMHDPLFANKDIVLVGPSSIGKGGPIKMATELLAEHKQESFEINISRNGLSASQVATLEKIEKMEREKAQKAHEDSVNGHSAFDKAHLFPRAADSTTYESLLRCMAMASRKCAFPDTDPDGKPFVNAVAACAMYASLEEMSSMFRRHTNDLINFLIQAYDCSRSYEYITKTQGKDRLLNICFNLIAGTTPNFMSSCFDTALVEEGFSSRVFFIYGDTRRKIVASIPQLTPEQKQYKKDLSQHVRGLKKLYGEVRIDESTETWFLEEYTKIIKDVNYRACRSPKLEPYYGRWNIHMKKLAMAHHFLNSYEMYLSREDFEWAIEKAREAEKVMHIPLVINEENPVAKLAGKIHGYLATNGPKEFNAIYAAHFKFAQGNKDGIMEAIEFLTETGQLRCVTEEDDTKTLSKKYRAL